MSGGHMDYLCYSVEEHANDLIDKQLVKMAKDFAKLLHDCEWYHSGDISKGEYNLTIKEFKDKWLKDSCRNGRLKEIIDESLDDMRKELYGIIGTGSHCIDCAMFEQHPDSNYGNCKVEGHMCSEHFYEAACENFQSKEKES